MAYEKYEFVLMKDHAFVISNLQRCSRDIQDASAAAYDMHNLDALKQEEIKNAQTLVAGIQADIAALKRFLPVKNIGKIKTQRYKPTPTPKQMPDKDFIERSQRALQNMSQNLALMRMQLK